MSIVIDGTLGVSGVQDGIISESKLATGAVTDGKLSLTPNSQEVKDALNATGSAPIYACRAWVNFNGTNTVAIRASGNVSSITDIAVGAYYVNFTTPMSDAKYVPVASCKLTGVARGVALPDDQTTTSLVVATFKNTAITTQADMDYISVAIFR